MPLYWTCDSTTKQLKSRCSQYGYIIFHLTSFNQVRKKNCLRVCHFNANSLRTRIGILRSFRSKKPLYYLIAISETKLGPLVEDSIVSLDG